MLLMHWKDDVKLRPSQVQMRLKVCDISLVDSGKTNRIPIAQNPMN